MKTIVTGALQATPEELDKLRALGMDITLHPDERQEVEDPGRYEAAICNGLFAFHDIRRFTNLRYIQLTSAGMDRVPLDYIRQRGIVIRNAAGVYSVPMAEWTIMRLLELCKNAGRLHADQADRRWEKDRSWRELAGKTACIVGFGAYGMETARRLKAFDVTVTVVNRTRKESPWVDRSYSVEALEEALAEADIVVMAVALTEQTRGVMDESRFAAMKDGAVFLNAARGALVDEPALIRALETGRLSGAALDVFGTEPLPQDSPLWNTVNLILSPHNSFVGEHNHARLMGMVVDNYRNYI